MTTLRTRAAVAAAVVGAGLLAGAPARAADVEAGFAARTPAVARAADGRLLLFATDGADRVWQRGQTAPGAATWTGWTELGGRMHSLAAVTRPDRRIALAGLDRAGRPHLREQTAAGGWTDWAAVDGTLASVSLSVDVGRLVLVGTDAAGATRMRTETAAGGWGGWETVPVRPMRAVTALQGAGLGLYGIDLGGSVARIWREAETGTWHTWTLPRRTMTAVAAVQAADGPHVFGADASGALWHAVPPPWDDEGPGEWAPIDGRGRSLAATADAEGRIAVLGFDGAGRGYQRRDLSPWTRVPGDLNAAFPDGGRVTDVDGDTFTPSAGPTSITVGGDGLPLAFHHDAILGDLRAVHCETVACSAATVSTVVARQRAGQDSAAVTGPDGRAFVAYTEEFVRADGTAVDTRLQVGRCENAACTALRTSTVVPGGVDGRLSLALDGDGRLLVGYVARSHGGVAHLATCRPAYHAACVTEDDVAIGAGYSATAVPTAAAGPDGLPLLVWEGPDRAGGGWALRLTRCADPRCGTYTHTIVDRGADRVGTYNSVTFGPDGVPLVSYTRGTGLAVAHCPAAGCAVTPVEAAAEVRRNTVRYGDDGLAVIVYQDVTNRLLQAAHCANVACRAFTRAPFARTAADAGVAMAIGADGLPVVAFHGQNPGTVTVAHCNNPRCVSFRLPPVATPAPEPDGVRSVGLVSCVPRPVTVWAQDHTAGTGWTRVGVLTADGPPPQCEFAYSDRPWTMPLTDGHRYTVRVVDPFAPGCVDNPEYLACVRLDKRDLTGAPSGLPHRDVVR